MARRSRSNTTVAGGTALLLLFALCCGRALWGEEGGSWRSTAFSSPSWQGSQRREAFARGRGASYKPRTLGLTGAGHLRHVSTRRAAEDEAESPEEPAGTGTVVGTAASVAKGMVGSGILSLAAGVAAFTRSPEGLSLSVLMLIAFTSVAAYSFQLVAWVSAETGSKDFGEAWSKSVGERFTWVPRFAVIVISVVSCIIYAMLLGDLLASILRGVLSVVSSGGALGAVRDVLLPWCQKGPVLVVLASTVLLPLCLQENFANLSLTSILGLVAAAYLACFVVYRFLDGSYVRGGQFFAAAPFTPLSLVPAQGLSDIVNLRSLVLMSNFGMAYMNHGMAPPTYQELMPADSAPGDAEAAKVAKLRKYRLVSLLSFGGAGVLCISVMVAGFMTFGPNSAGNLLANYANTDFAAAFARACVMFSVLCGFPLNFAILRVELNGIMKQRGQELSRSTLRLFTIGLLSFFVVAALLLGDIGQVQAVCGSILGSFIVYTAPAIMARSMRLKRGGGRRFQAVAEVGLIAVGAVVSVVGLTLSLRK